MVQTRSWEERIDAAAEALAGAKAVCVVTGAGVSAESRIPTFREAQSALADEHPDMKALWAEFDPMTLATPEAFARDPAMVTEWYDWRRRKCLAAEPNPGHRALARIEREVVSRGGSFLLATQNVDGLHRRAGSERMVELHGNLTTWRCTATDEEFEPGPDPFETYPVPSGRGGLLRPGVVWFGETLPPEAIEAAMLAAHGCDVFLTVGTSSVVYPAAGLVQLAKDRGAVCVEVNPDATPATGVVDLALGGASGVVLPRLCELAFG